MIDDLPMHFMWTHTLITGLRANVEMEVDMSGEYWLPKSQMK